MFSLYIIQSEQTDQYYIGSTKHISTRLVEHNAGKNASTRRYRPWKLIYTETYDTLSKARQREKQIKSWKNPAYMIKTLGIDGCCGRASRSESGK